MTKEQKLKDTHTCWSCGTSDKRVECGGTFHCTNLLCEGSGAAWFRHRLKSYSETGGINGTHEVDEQEWEFEAIRYLKENPSSGYVAVKAE